MKKELLVIFIILLISLFGVKALFHSGFYTSHDGEHQVIRLYQFAKTLSLGQFPPRWTGDLLNGYGYPLFNFNYQAPWFIALPFYSIGLSLTDSVKAAFIIGFFLSGMTMYLFLREVFGKKAAIFGAFLYLWAPYRFSNIFVRASLGEATAFIFVPLIFWGIYLLSKKFSWRAVVIGAIGVFGVALSHLMILVIFAIPIMLFLLFNSRCRDAKFCVSTIGLFLLGAGLSAYYIFPAVIEQSLTKFKDIMPLFYSNHFVTLGQLIYSKWDYGFSDGIRSAMSFQIGIGQWMIAALCLLSVGIMIMRKQLSRLNIVIPFLLIFLFSIFIMTRTSDFIWKLFEKNISLDYPWRFLSVAVFSAAVLGAWLISQLRSRKLFLIFGLMIAAVVFFTNRNHLNVNQYVYNPESFYIKNLGTTNSYDEYTPKWVQSDAIKIKPLGPIKSDANTTILENNTYKRVVFKTTGQGREITMNIIYFPGWKVLVDNKETKIEYHGNGLVTFSVPEGKHSVKVSFGESPVRKLSDIVTIISFLILIGGFFVFKKNSNKN